jgi:hypothetical protein
MARHRVGSILQRKASYTTIDRGAVGIIPVQMTVRESSVRWLNLDWTPASMQHSHRHTVKVAHVVLIHRGQGYMSVSGHQACDKL